jgi:uncharacterized Tic20 family protein
MKQEERSLAALIHLIIIIPLWGILGAGIIWMNYKEKNREVVFHAQQAIFFQCFFLAVCVIFLVFSLFCMLVKVINEPLALFLMKGNLGLLILCAAVYALTCIIAAVKVIMGGSFTYPWIGRKLRKELKQD